LADLRGSDGINLPLDGLGVNVGIHDEAQQDLENGLGDLGQHGLVPDRIVEQGVVIRVS